jgi:hypothetical protein
MVISFDPDVFQQQVTNEKNEEQQDYHISNMFDFAGIDTYIFQTVTSWIPYRNHNGDAEDYRKSVG